MVVLGENGRAPHGRPNNSGCKHLHLAVKLLWRQHLFHWLCGVRGGAFPLDAGLWSLDAQKFATRRSNFAPWALEFTLPESCTPLSSDPTQAFASLTPTAKTFPQALTQTLVGDARNIRRFLARSSYPPDQHPGPLTAICFA